MTQSIGDKIIAAIATANLALDEDGFPPMWATNAAEQLEAVVEAHIEERVRVRLELDREKDRRVTEKAFQLIGDEYGVRDVRSWLEENIT
jgi:hypothetical protein